jgi:hypothetical protein
MDKELIKIYYKMGLFTATDLDIFVVSKDITESEKQEIMSAIINIMQI